MVRHVQVITSQPPARSSPLAGPCSLMLRPTLALLLLSPVGALYSTSRCAGSVHVLDFEDNSCKLSGTNAGCEIDGSYDFVACANATVAPNETVALGNTILYYSMYSSSTTWTSARNIFVLTTGDGPTGWSKAFDYPVMPTDTFSSVQTGSNVMFKMLAMGDEVRNGDNYPTLTIGYCPLGACTTVTVSASLSISDCNGGSVNIASVPIAPPNTTSCSAYLSLPTSTLYCDPTTGLATTTVHGHDECTSSAQTYTFPPGGGCDDSVLQGSGRTGAPFTRSYSCSFTYQVTTPHMPPPPSPTAPPPPPPPGGPPRAPFIIPAPPGPPPFNPPAFPWLQTGIIVGLSGIFSIVTVIFVTLLVCTLCCGKARPSSKRGAKKAEAAWQARREEFGDLQSGERDRI